MANSEYAYVRDFEQWDALPPSNWIVVRVDGRGFSKLTKKHDFAKPNDRRGLDLMNAAAREVMRSLVDVVLAYGQSDEYSFVLHESTTLFERRAAKLATTVAAAFTAEYSMQWADFFPAPPTRPFPTFDARCVCYPKRRVLRDYLSWRQADCHVNNLYNTTFWNLVLRGGVSTTEAEEMLKGTVASDKNEILYQRFGINYNNEPEMYRKGTIVYRSYSDSEGVLGADGSGASTPRSPNEAPASRTQTDKERKRKQKASIVFEHRDIIGDSFWEAHPFILGGKKSSPRHE